MKGLAGFVWIQLLLAASVSWAQRDDVTFLVMGKTTNHRQEDSGQLSLLNYHFFAEIFVREGGRVERAELTRPDGEVSRFEDLGFVQEVHGGRYDRESELDARYPNGDYVFAFDASSGRVDHRVLTIRGTGEGQSRIPEPVRISLIQSGREVSSIAVDPNEDLTVSFSPFRDGAPDDNGILDDLIFVVMGDCHGEKVEHSGRPFEGTSFLTYRDADYLIPAEKLSSGEPHQIFVEHAKVDTSREDGIVGLVTYASTSFFDFRTTGEAVGEPCPRPMPKMDGGQTDRPQR